MLVVSLILLAFACILVLATFVAVGLLIYGKILQYRAKHKYQKKGKKKK